MSIGTVDRCRKEDIPAVARLLLKVRGDLDGRSMESWEDHYRKILFDNPWYDEEIPSLVFRSEDGNVEGILGVLVRRVVFEGKTIRMAILHSFMVAAECSSPMAAILLARECVNGAQDCIVSDRANEPGRKVMAAMGVRVSYLYSMHWLCILHPFQHVGRILERKRGFAMLGRASRPVSACMDVFVRKMWRKRIQSQLEADCVVQAVDCRSLMLSMNNLMRRTALHPEYSEADMVWLTKFFDGQSYCGRPQAIEILNQKGQRVGSCIYYLDAGKDVEILFYWAREDFTQTVFNYVLQYALDLGATSVGGRMDPQFFQSIANYPCRMRHKYWFIVHSRNPAIQDCILRGDAKLTDMDGEFVVTLS